MEVSEINILQIILDSGIVVKSVLLLLIFLSIVSWAVIFLKRRAIGNLKKNNWEFENFYRQSENLREVVEVSENLPFSSSKTIFMAGYEELENIKHSCMNRSQGEELQLYFERYGLQAIERAIQRDLTKPISKWIGIYLFWLPLAPLPRLLDYLEPFGESLILSPDWRQGGDT